MKRRLSILLLAILLAFTFVSCDEPEPEQELMVNITFKDFTDIVENSSWDSTKNFNNMNAAEVSKFNTDIAAQEEWKRVSNSKVFAVTSTEHDGFILVQNADGNWYSVEDGIETLLSKGSDPWQKQSRFSQFQTIVTGKQWNSTVNFNEMNESAKAKFVEDMKDSNWSMVEGETLFSVKNDDHVGFVIVQKADSTWFSIYDDVWTPLQKNSDPFKKPIVFSDFLDTYKNETWTESPDFNKMQDYEKKVFYEKLDASADWKRPEVEADHFTIQHRTKDLLIGQSTANKRWYKTVNGRSTDLYKPGDLERVGYSWNEFAAVIESRNWSQIQRLAELDSKERETFIAEAEEVGWTVSFGDAILVYNTVNSKCQIRQEFNNNHCYTQAVDKNGKTVGYRLYDGYDYIFDPDVPSFVTEPKADGTLKITGSYSQGKELTVPATIGEKKVTEIGNEAFMGGDYTKVTVETGVTAIGEGAFSDCASLTEIVLPEGLVSIGRGAFSGSGHGTVITIPTSVKTAGFALFFGWDSKSVVRIMEGCDLTNWDNGWNSESNAKLMMNWGSGNAFGWKYIDNGASIAITGFDTTTTQKRLEIPAKIGKHPVTAIDNNAFLDAVNLEEIVIPSSVVKIGINPFAGCTALKSIDLTGNETYTFFQGCVLTNNGTAMIAGVPGFKIPSGGRVTHIASEAWRGIPIDKLIIPKEVKTIDMNLREISENVGILCVEAGSEWVHDDWNADTDGHYQTGDTIIIENWVDENSSIGWKSYKNGAEITGAIPNAEGVVDIPANIGAENLPVIKIKDGAFKGKKSIKTVILPDGLEEIGTYAFSSCNNLKKVFMPNTVKSIGSDAFSFNKQIHFIYAEGFAPNSFGNIFGNEPKMSLGWIPGESEWLGVIENNEVWITGYVFDEDKLYDLEVPAEIAGKPVKGIKDNAFKNENITDPLSSHIKTVRFAEGIEVIGSYAFYGQKNLTDVYLSTTITTGGDECFNNLARSPKPVIWDPGCNAKWGSNVIDWNWTEWFNGYYGSREFLGVPISETEFAIQGYVGYKLMKEQTVYPSITIPSTVEMDGKTYTVTQIGCDSASSPNIGSLLGNDINKNYLKFKSLEIPNTVKKIGEYAISGFNLENPLWLPSSVTEILANGIYNNTPATVLLEGTKSGIKSDVNLWNNITVQENQPKPTI